PGSLPPPGRAAGPGPPAHPDRRTSPGPHAALGPPTAFHCGTYASPPAKELLAGKYFADAGVPPSHRCRKASFAAKRRVMPARVCTDAFRRFLGRGPGGLAKLI